MSSKEIWVFAEHREDGLTPGTLGLLGEARKLAGSLNGKACACILGYGIKSYFPLLGEGGAEKVYFSEGEIFSDCSVDSYLQTSQGFIAEYKPLMVIFDASSSGSELAARISLRMRLPYISEVKRVDVEKENLIISKSCYEDKVYQNVTVNTDRTVILSLLPADVDGNENNISGHMEFVEGKARYETGGIRTKCIKFLKGDPKKINLEEADMIVAGGKGIGKGASILEEFADLLGASLGGTRPLIDEGVFPFERQIGITGKSISPRLLFTFGISGAHEFITGTEKAKLTIAVNIDKNAPIFKNAEIKVHGDLKEIVPALVKRVKKLRESSK